MSLEPLRFLYHGPPSSHPARRRPCYRGSSVSGMVSADKAMSVPPSVDTVRVTSPSMTQWDPSGLS